MGLYDMLYTTLAVFAVEEYHKTFYANWVELDMPLENSKRKGEQYQFFLHSNGARFQTGIPNAVYPLYY